MEIAPRCSQAGLPFRGNNVGSERTLRRNTTLGTVQNTFGEPTAKNKPGPERYAPGPGRAVPSWKENRGGDFRFATDGSIFPSVRRIEPDIFILVLPPSSPLPDNLSRDSGSALEEQPIFTSVGYERRSQPSLPGQASNS